MIRTSWPPAPGTQWASSDKGGTQAKPFRRQNLRLFAVGLAMGHALDLAVNLAVDLSVVLAVDPSMDLGTGPSL